MHSRPPIDLNGDRLALPSVCVPRRVPSYASAKCDKRLLETTLAAALSRNQIKKITPELLRRFQSFAGTISAYTSELREVEGLGEGGVAALKTMHAGAIRLARAEMIGKSVDANWQCVINYLVILFAGEKVEQARVIYLDEANCVQEDEVHSTGSVNYVPVDARRLVRLALKLNARSIILAHNHPSGDPTPSLIDIEMTRSIKVALAAISVELRDHVVVANGRWVSIRSEQLL